MLKSAAEVRRAKFSAEVDAAGGVKAFVEKYGENPDYVRQLINGTVGFGHRAARRLEKVLGKPENWMDSEGEIFHSDTAAKDVKAIRIALTGLIQALADSMPPVGVAFFHRVKELGTADNFGTQKDLLGRLRRIAAPDLFALEETDEQSLRKAPGARTKR